MGTGCRTDSLQTRRLAAGLSISGLAKKANVSDWIVRTAEAGGTVTHAEAQRLADALAITTTQLGKKDL